MHFFTGDIDRVPLAHLLTSAAQLDLQQSRTPSQQLVMLLEPFAL
jgi:hypothetical protein